MNGLRLGNAKTLDTKLLRLLAPGEATDFHSDFYNRLAKFSNKLENRVGKKEKKENNERINMNCIN